jgi:hypothetical protein
MSAFILDVQSMFVLGLFFSLFSLPKSIQNQSFFGVMKSKSKLSLSAVVGRLSAMVCCEIEEWVKQ